MSIIPQTRMAGEAIPSGNVTMLVKHTPRSSSESTRQPSPQPANFFSLPAELRIYIYELVISKSVAKPVHIEHRSVSGWVLRHRGRKYVYLAQPPRRLLEVNRQIYREASDLLYQLCPGGPTLTIEHSNAPRDAWGWKEFTRISSMEMSPVREALPPILFGAKQRLTIEVVVPEDPREEVTTIALLKWMRTVLNTAPRHMLYSASDADNVPSLKEFRVIFRVVRHGNKAYVPREGMGIYDVFRGWRCCRIEATVTRFGEGQAFEDGEFVKMPLPTDEAVAGVADSERVAWKASEDTRKQMADTWPRKPTIVFTAMELPKPSEMPRWARGGR